MFEHETIYLGPFYINGIQSLSSFLQFKSYFVIFSNFINQAGGMYKVLLTGVVVLDETITFFVIKEFYCPAVHNN